MALYRNEKKNEIFFEGGLIKQSTLRTVGNLKVALLLFSHS
jgi:hypothetical protein